MPMLADLENPPVSRTRGLIIGTLVALPIVGLVAFYAIPALVAAVLGGSRDLDARLRATDSYVHSLCTEAFVPERDETLCGCALAVDFPSLDCREQYLEWALAQQQLACAEQGVREQAVSFCVCVETVAERTAESKGAVGVAAYERCERLADALALPTIRHLRATSRMEDPS